MTDDFDLRAVDGSLWRLRRRPDESDADYAERRRERAAQAATLKTYSLSWDDFEMIAGPTPNGHLVAQIDDLAAIARSITGDDVLEAVVWGWREVLSGVSLPGEAAAFAKTPAPGDEMPGGVTQSDLDAIARSRAEAAAGGGHALEDVLAEMDAIIDEEMPVEVADAIEREVGKKE